MVGQDARPRLKSQGPMCLWFTGLPASGKSTIANLFERRLFELGKHAYVLDGDNLRLGLNRDLRFSNEDRIENIRRVAEVARLFVDAGMLILVAVISPFQHERELARSRFPSTQFYEIFVDAPLAECERRDPKGLYAKARRGEIVNFTGIDGVYDRPESPDMVLDTLTYTAEQCADLVMLNFKERLFQPTLIPRSIQLLTEINK